jgi:histidyl-tRNA synthetase
MQAQEVDLPGRGTLVGVLGLTDDLADRYRVAGALRAAGIAARVDGTTRKLGKQLESAAKAGAAWAAIVGDELAEGRIGLKDLASGTQESVALDELVARLSG